ncbi:unnamed protein product [Adineta ricciae]|nr:unnamed protein product [Adineta ricciae]
MENSTKINQHNRENDLEIARLYRLNDEEQSFESGNDTVLTQFVTTTSDILLKMTSDSITSLHYGIIRGLIATAFRRIDSRRKILILQYLLDIGIIKRGEQSLRGYSTWFEIHFKDINMDNMNFDNLNLQYISFRNASLINSSFVNTNLAYADFTGTILTGANFTDAILDGVKLLNAQLQRTDLTRTSVANIQLDRTNLSQSSISDAQIAQALIMYNPILPNGTSAGKRNYVINGDGKQGTFGWNITGLIQVKSSSFTTNQDASMIQIIDFAEKFNVSLPDSISYCFSFRYRRGQYISFSIPQLYDYNRFWVTYHYVENLPTSPIVNSSNSDDFQSLIRCPQSSAGGVNRYLVLNFLFQKPNDTANENDYPAVKDIQITAMTSSWRPDDV